MKARAGFSFIELMVALVIVGILAALATGQYRSFVGRGAYAEVILAAKVYRRSVEVCALENALTSCDSGVNGIPLSNPTQAVSSVSVVDAVITVTPTAFKTITPADTYVLTPAGGGAGEPITAWNYNGNNHNFC